MVVHRSKNRKSEHHSGHSSANQQVVAYCMDCPVRKTDLDSMHPARLA
jgi:hypothetical protein